MKAIVTVIGKDRIGVIAAISTILAQHGVNILDIHQTVQQEYFSMVMLVDLSLMKISFADMKEKLTIVGKEMGMEVRIQREDIFQSMNRL
jgi:ACT domain-containing protein